MVRTLLALARLHRARSQACKRRWTSPCLYKHAEPPCPRAADRSVAGVHQLFRSKMHEHAGGQVAAGPGPCVNCMPRKEPPVHALFAGMAVKGHRVPLSVCALPAAHVVPLTLACRFSCMTCVHPVRRRAKLGSWVLLPQDIRGSAGCATHGTLPRHREQPR